jgi:hypothetical protein
MSVNVYGNSSLYNDNLLEQDNNITVISDTIAISMSDTITAAESTNGDKGIFVKGFKGFAEVGFDIRTRGMKSFDNWLKVNYISAYQFSNYITFGLGAGLRYNLQEARFLFPVFLALRSHYRTNKKVEPFFSIYGGYTVIPEFPLNEGGYFLSPQIGMNIKKGRKSSFYIGLGVEIRMDGGFGIGATSYYPYYRPFPYGYNKDSFHTSILIGYSF